MDFTNGDFSKGDMHVHTPHTKLCKKRNGSDPLCFMLTELMHLPIFYCTTQQEDKNITSYFLFSWTGLLQLFGLEQLPLLEDGPALVHQKSMPAEKEDP